MENKHIFLPENGPEIPKEDLFHSKPLYKWLLLGFLFAAAFGIRVYRISDPPLEFNPTWQYYSSFFARSYYYENNETAPQWKKDMAALQMPPAVLPPVTEWLSSRSFFLFGGENFWFPRMLSSVFWLVAAAGVFQISRRLWSSDTAAVFSLVVFLFLPFGIFASRSFQPDSFMVMLMVFSFLAMTVYARKTTLSWVIIAGLLAAATVFIKILAGLMLVFTFASIVFSQKGLRKTLVNPHLWIFSAIAVSPVVFHYLLRFQATGLMQARVNFYFHPGLLLSPAFYKDWLQTAGYVFGYSLLFISLLAIPLSGYKKWRGLFLTGMWLGYLVFGFVFNYHISTRPYYQLQLFPAVALTVGYAASLVAGRLRDRRIPDRIMALGTALLIVLLALDGMAQVVVTRYRIEKNRDFTREVQTYEEIGELTGHNGKCIFLAREYGAPLRYHGWLYGAAWPSVAWDMASLRLQGKADLSAGERYLRDYAPNNPEFFIITDFNELGRQPDLKSFLQKTFPVNGPGR